MDDLFRYGVAIDFLGNYRKEGKAASDAIGDVGKRLSGFAARASKEMDGAGGAVQKFMGKMRGLNDLNSRGLDRITGSLFNLKNLLVGGAMVLGLGAFQNKIMETGKSLETMYATLDTVFHDQKRVQGLLDWASRKAVDTPFEMLEVTQAVTSLAQMGKAKTNEMLNENFMAIGDFAASKGRELGEVTDMVSKAAFGNWERLGDNFGMRLKMLPSMAANAVGPYRNELIKTAATLQKVKAGTNEYSAAVIKFIGLYSKGGMEKRVKTVAGAISNMKDLVSNFYVHMVGLSQVEGTLFNGIGKSLNRILGVFDQVKETDVLSKQGIRLQHYNRILSETEKLDYKRLGWSIKEVTIKDKLFRLAEKAGNILLTLWGSVETQILGGANALAGFIDKLEVWSNDFPNKVAPLIVFLSLLKFKIQDMWTAFSDGFMNGIKPLMTVIDMVISFAKLFTGPGEKTAGALGTILGFMLSIAGIGMIVSPFANLINGILKMTTAIRALALANAAATAATGVGAGAAAGGAGAGWLARSLAAGRAGIPAFAKAAGNGLVGGAKSLATGFAARGGVAGTVASFAPGVFGSGGNGITGYGQEEYQKMGFSTMDQYGQYRKMAKAKGFPVDEDRLLIPGSSSRGFERDAAQLKMLRDTVTGAGGGRAAAPAVVAKAPVIISTLNLMIDTKNGGIDMFKLTKQLEDLSDQKLHRQGKTSPKK